MAFSEKKFIQEIKLLVRLEESRINVGKQRLRVWKGIALTDVHDVHDVHDFCILKESVDNTDISKGCLGKKNGGQGGQGGQGDNYAKCEICGTTALLTSYNLDDKEVMICYDCKNSFQAAVSK